MSDYSVLAHWKGKAPFNETVDSMCGLSKDESKNVADIYCGNKKSDKVDIIHCVDGNRVSKNIKLNGARS